MDMEKSKKYQPRPALKALEGYTPESLPIQPDPDRVRVESVGRGSGIEFYDAQQQKLHGSISSGYGATSDIFNTLHTVHDAIGPDNPQNLSQIAAATDMKLRVVSAMVMVLRKRVPAEVMKAEARAGTFDVTFGNVVFSSALPRANSQSYIEPQLEPKPVPVLPDRQLPLGHLPYLPESHSYTRAALNERVKLFEDDEELEPVDHAVISVKWQGEIRRHYVPHDSRENVLLTRVVEAIKYLRSQREIEAKRVQRLDGESLDLDAKGLAVAQEAWIRMTPDEQALFIASGNVDSYDGAASIQKEVERLLLTDTPKLLLTRTRYQGNYSLLVPASDISVRQFEEPVNEGAMQTYRQLPSVRASKEALNISADRANELFKRVEEAVTTVVDTPPREADARAVLRLLRLVTTREGRWAVNQVLDNESEPLRRIGVNEMLLYAQEHMESSGAYDGIVRGGTIGGDTLTRPGKGGARQVSGEVQPATTTNAFGNQVVSRRLLNMSSQLAKKLSRRR